MADDFEADVTKIEQVATEAGNVAAAVGGAPGKIVDAAIVGAETIANSVVAADAARHHTLVADAANALQAAIDKTPSAVAGLPPDAAQTVILAAEQASGLLATLKAAWRDVEMVFKEVKTIV